METNPRLLEIFLNLATIEGLSGNEKAVGSYIKTFLRNLDLPFREDDTHKVNGGNSGNIIARVGEGGQFVLLSHMDTARSTGALKPQVQDGRVCSDGSTILGADNRAGIAAILYAVESAIRQRRPLKAFTIAFTVCEETTLAGSQHLNLDKQIGMGFVFDSALRPGNFVCQSFGAQKFAVTIRGKAAHSGIAPEKGISAIAAAARGVDRLRLGRIDEITTANIGIISGGTAVNVVPEETVLRGEVRSLDPAKVDSLIDEIEQHFTAAARSFGAGMEFASQWEFRPYRLTPEMPVYREIESAIRRSGLNPAPQVSAGGSDANSLNAKGIPTVNIGIGAQNPHANDEFILLEDLQKTADIARQLIEK